MAATLSVKFNQSAFDDTLRQYLALTKKDPKKVCDTKAFFIARRAVLETPKASAEKIKTDLGKVIRSKKVPAKLSLRTVKRYSRWGLEEAAPLAALIIQARRARAGKDSLFKWVTRAQGAARMTDAIKAMISARMRSIAYIKSGWLPAIRKLLPYADKKGAPRQESGPKVVGKEKGTAVPARDGPKARTIIENAAYTKRDKKDALYKYGEPALAAAFEAERISMLEYMERKYRETAQKAGIRTN